MINYKRFLWALRKIRLPINSSAVVLDVGSGGNPHPRADVLIDRLGGAEHRGGEPMLIDRCAVIGDATKLPFKDQAFDFVIASHILEHMPDPGAFLSELQRVAKAGYIETPNFLCERLIPTKAHCLEVANIDGVLRIHKKSMHLEDPYISGLNFLKNDHSWRNLYFQDPALFHTQYFWKTKINYQIVNPEESCSWIQEVYDSSNSIEPVSSKVEKKTSWRSIGSSLYESIQRKKRIGRLRNFEIESALACPDCKGSLNRKAERLVCTACNHAFSTLPHINFEIKV